MAELQRCTVYDQISDRHCRYDAGHGGKHNFARLDHDTVLERELRRELDAMTRALTEALDLFDATWCELLRAGRVSELGARAAELRKLVQP
jgi:hypothetical protein